MISAVLFILPLAVIEISLCRSLHEPGDRAVATPRFAGSNANRTWVQESGKNLTKPYVMSENTLSGKSDVVGIDRILFPASYSRLPQPLRNVVNTIVRIPVIVAGLIIGENAELIGLQAMQVGNALLMMGSHKFGESPHLISCRFTEISPDCRIYTERLCHRIYRFRKDCERVVRIQ